MKIYTKGGDKGQTSLFGGKRLSKDHIRIEAYGTIDELNSFVGLLTANLPTSVYNNLLVNIQNRLFDIGSHLASDADKMVLPSHIDDNDIKSLENGIDAMNEELPPLKNFILPGGSQTISLAHVCRTICRRAERRVVTLQQNEEIENQVVIYLNRLSDFFFTLARYEAHVSQIEEIKWQPKKTD